MSTDRIHVFSLAAEESVPGEADNTRVHTILTAGTKHGRTAADNRKITFTAADLEQMANNHSMDVPVDIHHATLEGHKDPESTAARGWIKGLDVDGDELKATIEWTDEGAGYIADRKFKYFSAEPGKAKDKDSGDEIGWRIHGGTLTNHPYWDLPALAFSDAVSNELATDDGGSQSRKPVIPDRSSKETESDTKENEMSDDTVKLAEQIETLTAEKAALEESHTAALSELQDKLDLAEKESKGFEKMVALAEKTAKEAKDAVLKIQEDSAIAQLLTDGKIKNDEEELDAAREAWQLKQSNPDSKLWAMYEGREAGSVVPIAVDTGQRLDESDTVAADMYQSWDEKVQKLAEEKGIDYLTANQKLREQDPDGYDRMHEAPLPVKQRGEA